jgi:hypothetical protein
MGLRQDLKRRAISLSQKAMEKIFANEERAMRIAGAIGKVQRGKAAFDRGQDQLLRSLSVAARSDFKEVGKQLSGLKRRLADLEEKVDQLGAHAGRREAASEPLEKTDPLFRVSDEQSDGPAGQGDPSNGREHGERTD